jgi:hypothetical protein
MFSLFTKLKRSENNVSRTLSYIGVASMGYDSDFSLYPLVSGKLDEKCKRDFIFVSVAGNKRFTNFEEALKYTSRRGVTDNSAYVIGLKCSIDEIDTYRKKGELSSQILNITNAMTRKSVPLDSDLLKPNNNDNNSQDNLRQIKPY